MASGGKFCDSLLKLQDNDADTFHKAVNILLTFADNIIKSPNELKYRRIRVGNVAVTEKLLPASGAIECLFDMGFEEDGEYFTMSPNNSLGKVTQFRDQLLQMKESRPQPSSKGAEQEVAKSTSVLSPQQLFNIQRTEARFMSKVKGSYDHVLMYEDPKLQFKALQCIPRDELISSASKKQNELKNQGEDVDLQDLILLELLAWFKQRFFSWLDKPQCVHCGGETQNAGMAQPTDAELMWGAGRVENYKCTVCERHTRFPRYNHPGKLLETRNGRCGEWANCFTLCCRAMEFEARYILDWTDHVWTEVYSENQQKWLHCDPCENICDKPLIYEVGWKKKLSYILAFSKDDVQDVTWRYSANHEDVMTRRKDVREPVLLRNILQLREKRQQDLPESRKKVLSNRLVAEIVEFMSSKTAGEGETEGRKSGSMAWRLVRGETSQNQIITEPFTIKPSQQEIKDGAVHVKYCCALDQYVRVSNEEQKIRGWESLVYKSKDVFRKYEYDWKMVYLARKEGCNSASVSWKFDLQDTGYVIDKVEAQALSDVFETGSISWKLCAGDQCAILHGGGKKTLIDSLSGSSVLTLEANLSGGKGDTAWQHTQLFRQKDNENNIYPFDIRITLKKL